jgi:hypothetical protein
MQYLERERTGNTRKEADVEMSCQGLLSGTEKNTKHMS